MISPIRALLACLLPLVVSGLIAGCGGGGGGSTGSSSGPSPAVPTVTTPAATSVGATSAILNGSVIPNGLPTQYWFEYGTDPILETSDNTAGQPVGSGTASQPVADSIGDLAPGTTYYYRICASNSAGTAQSPIVSFTTPITYACLDCHGGVDGTRPGVNGAPVITKYWQTSGHGRSAGGPPLQCEDCHDVGAPAGSHAADGSGTFNTLAWPGKADNTANTNTAHLKNFFFPVSPSAAADYALALDNACGNRIGCHARDGGGRIAGAMTHAKWDSTDSDFLMEFGTHGTPFDPKLYAWYSQTTYRDDFYKSQSAWTVADLTTDAAGPPLYGTCVSCHDPHGTGTTDRNTAGRNVMLRGNWKTPPSQFCNGLCHL